MDETEDHDTTIHDATSPGADTPLPARERPVREADQARERSTSAASNQHSSSSPAAVRWSCLVVWLALASVVALLEIERRAGTLHPLWVPFVLLLGLAVAAAIVGLMLAAVRLWRAIGSWKSLWLWAAAIVLPFFLFAAPFLQASRQWAARQVPHGPAGQLVIVAAGGMMEGQAACFYPHRLETDRLVMFYHELDHPEHDVETMDRHVAQLERQIGAPLRAKIHWVRGTLLGQGNCSFLGLALGSTFSPDGWSRDAGYLDRHELAHAVIVQQRPISADPPTVLHEGWAESQSGLTSKVLARRALEERERNPDLRIADLFQPEWYYNAALPVYTLGGAFVDHLLRHHGPAKFIELYNRTQPHTFEADIAAIYGQSLAELETAFWSEAETIANESPRP